MHWPDQIKLCSDKTCLSQCMKTISPKLAGEQYLSILSAKSSYWNLQVDTIFISSGTFQILGAFLAHPLLVICSGERLVKLSKIKAITYDILVVGLNEDGTDHDVSL